MGDDAGIEARSSKLEIRVSNIHIRASIRASTTINVNFNLQIRAGFPLPLDEPLIFYPIYINFASSRQQKRDDHGTGEVENEYRVFQ